MQTLKSELKKAIKTLYQLDIDAQVSRSPENTNSDYSSNIAFILAKQLGKSPKEIAEEITTKMQAENANGFLNFTIKGKDLKLNLDQSWHEKYGENTENEDKIAIVEYPSPNLAKPFSVGHLRPANHGWAAKNLLEAAGWKVITDNHLGDTGTPFGIWVIGFEMLSSEEALARDGVYELGRIYIEMKKLLKEEEEKGNDELKLKVQDWLIKLENGDETARTYNEKFNEISLNHIHEVQSRLKISTDYELGELFFMPIGKEAVQKYLEQKIFKKNEDGSIICELEGFDTPMLMLKSNGSALYATTDLGTAVYRDEHFKPNLIVHAAGAEQKFYFEQLFAMQKKIGLKNDNYHLWFGMIDQLVDGKREKMSSRKGTILLEELLDRAENEAKNLTATREEKPSEEDIKKIALGAIKFTDFMADRKTGILFDWEKIFSLNGFSCPFVQYSAVRIKKILERNKDLEIKNYENYDFEPEKDLIITLLEYPEIVKISSQNFEAHRIVNYTYKLAKELNRYYETTNVSNSEPTEKSARIDVLKKTLQVFNHALNLVGIEIPERM